jgi:hypothetical protein
MVADVEKFALAGQIEGSLNRRKVLAIHRQVDMDCLGGEVPTVGEGQFLVPERSGDGQKLVTVRQNCIEMGYLARISRGKRVQT